jgi:hypothetical protein
MDEKRRHPMTQTERLHSRVTSWPLLLAGMALTTMLALSVHVVMLQNLHVPYPYHFPHTGWPTYPAYFFITISAVYIEACSRGRLAAISPWLRCGILFLQVGALRELLFRAPFMNFINGNPYSIYPWVENIPL